MPHTAELIAVGTELLLGGVANTDAQMISKGLSALGFSVYYHTVVGDNPARLRAAVDLARTRADIILTTGGLGPTCDDLTKTVLADCFGKRLCYNAEAEDRCRAYFARQGRTMSENNRQQFYLPEGCVPFQNDWGTAPGCAFEAEGTHVLMLPGPPRECREMFRHRAVPYLQALAEGVILSRTLKLFGIGEADMEQGLRAEMRSMENPTLAPYAKEGTCELRITARAESEEEAQALIAPVEGELRGAFGDLIYGTDEDSLESMVLRLLLGRGLTLSAAESCTGGLIAKRITDLSGSSAAFQGGVVSYTNFVKHHVLGVPQEILDEFSAVSFPVACAMAQGVRRVTGSDLGVSATGVAGPGSDDRGNPVGLIYVGFSAPEGTWVRTLHEGTSRERNRTVAAHHAFDLTRRYLLGLDMRAERQ